MKKLYFLLITLLITSVSFSQVLLNENFEYGATPGDLTALTANWTGFSGSTPRIGYITTSLSMTNYPSTALGGSITIAGSSEDAERSFSDVTSGVVYTSILFNASAVSQGSEGTYFYSFRENGSYHCRLYTKTDGSGGMVFGVREGSESSTTFGTTSFALDTTYLLVLKYDFTAGEVSLYVMPSVIATEGAATVEASSSLGNNATVLNGVAFRQATGSPTANIDGLRVATTWNDIMNQSTDPLVEVGAGVTGLNYEVSNGPSAAKLFTVEGIRLTADILVTAPTDFEISQSENGTYTPTITLTQAAGVVTQTNIYARLKSGLTSGATFTSYSGNVTVESTGAATQTVSLEGIVYNTLSRALTITGVTDPTPVSPRTLEIHVGAAIADLSAFGMGSANNGNGGGTVEFTFPAVAAAKGDYIYIVSSGQTADFNTYFGNSITPYESGAMSINGDDALELFENAQVIDVFGDVNKDGTGEAWEYTDGWAYRNTAGPKTTFTSTEWTYSGVGTLDGANNTSSTNPFPIGTYSSVVLSTNNPSLGVIGLYPNPVTSGSSFVTISSNTTEDMQVVIYNLLGKQLKRQKVTNNQVDVSSLRAGVYLVQVLQGNKQTSKKLIIQ